MIRGWWGRIDRPTRVALLLGLVLVIWAIPLPTLVSVVLGLAAAALLGYVYPADATRVALFVALPALVAAFVFGFVRGFNTTLLLVILVPSLIAPVWLARQGAILRRGRGA